MPGEKLHAHRKVWFPFGLSARNGNARDAGKAGGNGVDIGEIHLQGIVHTLAELEGGDGEVGVTITSTSSNASRKSLVMRVRTFWAFK